MYKYTRETDNDRHKNYFDNIYSPRYGLCTRGREFKTGLDEIKNVAYNPGVNRVYNV